MALSALRVSAGSRPRRAAITAGGSDSRRITHARRASSGVNKRSSSRSSMPLCVAGKPLGIAVQVLGELAIDRVGHGVPPPLRPTSVPAAWLEYRASGGASGAAGRAAAVSHPRCSRLPRLRCAAARNDGGTGTRPLGISRGVRDCHVAAARLLAMTEERARGRRGHPECPRLPLRAVPCVSSASAQSGPTDEKLPCQESGAARRWRAAFSESSGSSVRITAPPVSRV